MFRSERSAVQRVREKGFLKRVGYMFRQRAKWPIVHFAGDRIAKHRCYFQPHDMAPELLRIRFREQFLQPGGMICCGDFYRDLRLFAVKPQVLE